MLVTLLAIRIILMSEDLPNTIFEIHEYIVTLRQREVLTMGGLALTLRCLIRCLGDTQRLDLYFVEEQDANPPPHYDAEKKQGRMVLPFRDFAIFMDLLRNEGPIYAHLRSDKPEWSSITTSREPVGEGE